MMGVKLELRVNGITGEIAGVMLILPLFERLYVCSQRDLLKGNLLNINEESVCDEKDEDVLKEMVLTEKFRLKDSWRYS